MRPQRIVTLLPSATEIVAALGLADKLVGVTHECDFPPEVAALPSVTSSAISKGLASDEIDRMVHAQLETRDALYTIDRDLLASLRPDLIVTQALCDVCAVAAAEVEEVAASLPTPPALVNLEPMSLTEVFDTILLVGETCGVGERATRFVNSLKQRVDRVREATRHVPPRRRPGVAFLEWIDPPFNAGHWNPELIELAGGVDCLGCARRRSHRITFGDIQAANPDILVIALCGFDVERARQDIAVLRANLDWERLTCVRENQVHVLDGNAYFSRSGPRLVDSLEILAGIIARATRDNR